VQSRAIDMRRAALFHGWPRRLGQREGLIDAMSKGEGSARKRMAPHERETQIVRAAIRFFAERGFDGNTRDLLKGIGVTQPLLYRYFPTKEALIERVYEEVFAGVWNPDWERWLDDRERPIADRLRQFYRSYARGITTYEWIRLFMFSSLRGLDFNRRYLSDLRTRIFTRIIRALRIEAKAPSIDELPMTPAEIEAVWSLHAAIYYLGVRKHIHHLPTPPDPDADIDDKVNVFLRGVFAVVAQPE
jgi:AcrR family transcriptional regulator